MHDTLHVVESVKGLRQGSDSVLLPALGSGKALQQSVVSTSHYRRGLYSFQLESISRLCHVLPASVRITTFGRNIRVVVVVVVLDFRSVVYDVHANEPVTATFLQLLASNNFLHTLYFTTHIKFWATADINPMLGLTSRTTPGPL